MSAVQALEGSCSCGRCNYVVSIPQNQREQAQVHFRTDDEHRRSQAALLTAFLRVPLAWYTSQTISFFPDETHRSISRTFSPIDEPHTQRKFCGYCGTHLSYWTEQPREEQDYLHITLGSLRNRDLDTLQDLELLPEDLARHVEDRSERTTPGESQVVTTQSDGSTRTVKRSEDGSMTWFEEMLDGSHLGRTRQSRKVVGVSRDGTTTVSYEVTEYGGDADDGDVVMTSSSSNSKRKLGDVEDGSH